jgi:renalase
MASVAIIGAGISGLAAAHILIDAGHTVTLFEKDTGVGGRAATRKRDGFTYDHGAQYIKGGGPISTTWITQRFRVPDLIDISKPVWTFDAEGHIQEGDPVQNADPRWNYRRGLVTLAKRMAEGLDIRLETYIARVERTTTGWRLFGESETRAEARTEASSPSLPHSAPVPTAPALTDFEQLLITIPAAQAVAFVENSQMPGELQAHLLANLRKAHYNPLISVMLGYKPIPRTRPYYALVNTDKAHPISWLAWEHEKAPERVPEQTGLLIAQMAPQYSLNHWQTPAEEVISDVAKLVAVLIDEPMIETIFEPVFTDIYNWRYALPAEKADVQSINTLALPYGLAFCGDAFVGGRVHLALEHGVEVAHQLSKVLI